MTPDQSAEKDKASTNWVSSFDFLGKRLIRWREDSCGVPLHQVFLADKASHPQVVTCVLNSVDSFLWMIHYDGCHLPQSQQTTTSRLAKDFDLFIVILILFCGALKSHQPHM